MKFIWEEGKTTQFNRTLAFSYKAVRCGDVLTLAAGDFYRVFLNGEFLSYGPSRTAAGYSRLREIVLPNDGVGVVEVAGYNTACYSNDKFPPYFGAEIIRDGSVVATTDDFIGVYLNDRLQKVERYSYQRNYVEIYTQEGDRYSFYRGTEDVFPSIKTAEVPYAITLLGSGEDTASYEKLSFAYIGEKISNLQELSPQKLFWSDYIEKGLMEGYLPKEQEFQFTDFIKDKTTRQKMYMIPSAHTGFIRADFTAQKDGFALLVFDEYGYGDNNVDIRFQRSTCNDYVLVHLKKGERTFLSFEPYELKCLHVYLSDGTDVCNLSLIALENKEVTATFTCKDEDIATIYNAAVNSFRQNALDIFMDCPGRERAGWLCDSFFTAQAEALLCGKSDIEKRFLQNFLVGEWEEIPRKMFPMCFPSELYEKVFIPNWAMWFLVELEQFSVRAPESELVSLFKEKAYGILEYFQGFENEYGLLEDLKGWIFLEWSIANDPSHVCGVNIPSNMMYAKAITSVAKLYADDSLLKKAEKIKATVVDLGFDGKVFRDNLVRESGKLVLTNNYSETCQYYALFCGMSQGAEFEKYLFETYGTESASKLPEASNMLTGHCLRLWWLLDRGYKKECIAEAKRMFLGMAKQTGTLWENDNPNASCNHGFTSIVTVFLTEAIFGYKGYDAKQKILKFDEDFCEDMNCKIALTIEGKTLEINIENGERTIINDTDYKIIKGAKQ